MSAVLTEARRIALIERQSHAVNRIEDGIALIRSGQINPGVSMVAHAAWDLKYLLISMLATEVL